jgi:hypothetical protein
MESIHGEASLHDATFREPSPSAANQRERILSLLRDAARSGQGVSGDALRYEHKLRQAPTRIFELKNHYGYQIETLQDPDTRLATYFFRRDPPEGWHPRAKQTRLCLKAKASSDTPKSELYGTAAPAADSRDWYERATGKPRPSLDQENFFLFDRERR